MGISFEEFIGRLQTVQKNFPDDVETVLNRGANRMIKALKTNSPDSGKDHKRKLKAMARTFMPIFILQHHIFILLIVVIK